MGAMAYAMLAVSLAAEPENALASLAARLPEAAGSWAVDAPAKVFDKDTIFNHINGESEIYFPYGFRGVAAATYANASVTGVTISADLYWMGSPLDAFGIYSNYRRPDADFLELGCEGYVTDSQLLFYQDAYFVRLTAVGRSEQNRDHLKTIAEAIRAKLPRAPACPDEVGLVAVPGTIPKTETYQADSLLGYAFFPRGILAKARIGEAAGRLFVVMLDSPDDAATTAQRYADYLQAKGSLEQGTPYHSGMDPLYKRVTYAREGRFVFGAIEFPEGVDVEPMLEIVRARLR